MADWWSWLPREPVPCTKNTRRQDESSFGELHQQEHFKRTFCKGCPVAYDCLRHAIRMAEWHGVWGGMTVAERNRFASQFRRHSAKAKAAHDEHLAKL